MFKVFALLALLTGSSLAAINFEREFDDFPGFRFTEWSSLSPDMQTLAMNGGYTSETWNSLGSGGLEGNSWDELSGPAQQAFRQMGFREETWDCYVNHYNGYSWNELVQEDLADAAKILGVSEHGRHRRR